MAEGRNPFLKENFLTGGGYWDQQIITITHARFVLDKLPFNDDKTGEPAIRRCLKISAIADTEEVERQETYSTGSLIPNEDGLGLRHPQGKEVLFHSTSEISKFADLIVAGGYDANKLYPNGKLDASKLEGERFLMKSEPQLDKKGEPKKNAKGFIRVKYWPLKYEGRKDNFAAPTGGPSPELRAKAVAAVSALLDENGGKLSRADTVRKLSSKLSGDKDVNKIIALISREDFHKDVPWTRDGTTYSKVQA